MNRNIILLVFMNISIFMNAQNQYRIGDELQVEQISFQTFPNIAGNDLTWNMQENNMPRYFHDIKFINCVDTSFKANISKLVEGTNFFYYLGHDSLLLKGYRNKKISVQYNLPITEQTIPLTYSDSLQGYYSGKGILANNKYALIAGKYNTSVCGRGKLITLDADTLGKTLLIKSTRLVSYKETSPNKIREKYGNFENIPTPSYKQIEDQIKNDSNIIRVEKLSWYSPGYRYAILETAKAYFINEKNNKLFEYALYYAPDNQKQLVNDSINENIRIVQAYSMRQAISGHKGDTTLKKYKAKQNNDGKSITVTFLIEDGNNVAIGIYTANGSCLYHHDYGWMNKGYHTKSIDLSEINNLSNQAIIVTTFIDGKPNSKKYIYN